MLEAISYVFDLFLTNVYLPIVDGLQSYSLMAINIPFGTSFTTLGEIIGATVSLLLTGVILALPYWVLRLFRWVVR